VITEAAPLRMHHHSGVLFVWAWVCVVLWPIPGWGSCLVAVVLSKAEVGPSTRQGSLQRSVLALGASSACLAYELVRDSG
jgi:hypothetical protein